MQKQTSLKIGDKLPEFKLVSTNGRECDLHEFEDSKIIVVMFICNHCDYVKAYEDRLIGLQKKFADQGVTFVAINANDEIKYPENSFENMLARAKIKQYNFPYLRDKTQEVAKMFGAQYTPEIFVFDHDRILRYHGRVDNNWQDPQKVTSENLKEAIESLLIGQSINIPETNIIGCTVMQINN